MVTLCLTNHFFAILREKWHTIHLALHHRCIYQSNNLLLADNITIKAKTWSARRQKKNSKLTSKCTQSCDWNHTKMQTQQTTGKIAERSFQSKHQQQTMINPIIYTTRWCTQHQMKQKHPSHTTVLIKVIKHLYYATITTLKLILKHSQCKNTIMAPP